VTVREAGPAIAALAPSTVYITQGAFMSLTVSLNAVQATDTEITIRSSDAGVVGVPPAGTVTVPPGKRGQSFEVFGGGAASIWPPRRCRRGTYTVKLDPSGANTGNITVTLTGP
jgi:hypothetical protein